ncbi:Avirulence protein (Avh) [Phytophthora palmivora]|uniref:Avirulence protein (Avh) n=1 Tax=Phytophthora palmivora TaxID=4796 RepID=A0A2P4X9K2_9STRA|nr:Avirulence protein (Avh) [Phytophthora palmivora]
MRLRCMLLLVGATLFASMNASSVTMGMKTTNPYVTTRFHGLLSTRKLVGGGNDEERVSTSFPVAGKLADLLETGASKIAQSTRIRAWLLRQISTDDVFNKLKLNMVGTKIFDDPKFITWVVYVTKVHKQNPEEIILSKLMTQFSPDTLAKMIAAAKKVSTTEGLAIMLQSQQRQVWLNAGKSTDDVFSLLKLDERGNKLFKSSQFSTWTSYVDAFNRKNPEEAVTIFSKLTKMYDDVTLSKMLEAAKKVPRMEAIVTKLQSQQIQAWIDAGASTDDVFKMLKLDKTGTNLFKNTQFTTWVSFVDAFNKNFPDDAVSIFAKLSKTYDDVTLSSMLESAKSVPTTKKIASYLQAQQNQHWLADGKSTDDIFKLLKLDIASLENLIDPRLSAWTSFMRAYNMASTPGQEASLVATMSKHYTELGLAQLLEAAKIVPQTEKIAKDLQVAQFTRWLNEGKTQDDVAKLLQLNQNWRTDPDSLIIRQYNQFYKAH